ncbi:hypothetical protein ACFWP0_18670 [Achromobacter sp. NPDC058515]|uniref:hypothetical protein n=1 Tax=Achromobacter sp. NPDC058515 TaxID=3346533 RepID=UPI0036619E06
MGVSICHLYALKTAFSRIFSTKSVNSRRALQLMRNYRRFCAVPPDKARILKGMVLERASPRRIAI